jgi:hypothetical protein
MAHPPKGAKKGLKMGERVKKWSVGVLGKGKGFGCQGTGNRAQVSGIRGQEKKETG